MYNTVTENEFIRTMKTTGFSTNGAKVLFNYLEKLEEEEGKGQEFYPIDIDCEWNERENLEEFQKNYNYDYKSVEDIQQDTTVIIIDNESFITGSF